MIAACGVFVRIIASKPVLVSTTPPLMIFSSSSSSSVVVVESLLLFVVLVAVVPFSLVGVLVLFYVILTLTSKRGAPRLIFPVANKTVYLSLIAFKSAAVYPDDLSGSIE